MRKRIISALLIMMFILAGCGGDKPSVKKPVSKEYTDSNKNSKITEKKIVSDVLLFFDEIFGRIHSYKMLNNTEKEIHPYLNFLIFQSLNNDFIITEYKKKFFEELNKGNSQFKK